MNKHAGLFYEVHNAVNQRFKQIKAEVNRTFFELPAGFFIKNWVNLQGKPIFNHFFKIQTILCYKILEKQWFFVN